MRKLVTITVCTILFSIISGCRGNQTLRKMVDSLNQCAYETRYKNIDTTARYAQEAYDMSAEYDEGRAVALNNLAFVQFMRMDFDSARVLYGKSTEMTRSELTRLMNDVGMMNVCKIVALNKEYYTYRADAERKIHRLEESEVKLTPLQTRQFNYARTEYHFNSSSYHSNMWQEAEADSELNIVRNNLNWLHGDVAQQIRFNLLERNYRRAFDLADESALTFMQASALMNFSDSMALFFAQPALNLFREYGSVYSTALAYVKISDCLLHQGMPEAALDTATKALEYVNIQHQRLYGKDTEFLYPYHMTDDTISTEMRWMKEGNITCAWEWIATIREHLSKIYASLGMKQQSDYNRNIYLDILEATRQDKLLEARRDELNEKNRNLTAYMIADIILAALILLAAYLIMKHMRTRAINRYEVERKQSDEKFSEWMNDLQSVYESLDEKESFIDSETYMSGQRIAEQKRSYIDKCTSMSMVMSINPFLDRALNEVERLSAGNEDEERIRERKEYLTELIDRINLYNETLSHWIKIRQGTVSLNIENFALQPLLETLTKNHNSFTSKGIDLDIQPTELCVKADRALTLFMMNTLLDNARKYTPSGGRVSLEVSELDDAVEVAISDTGEGISEHDIHTILTEKVYDSSTIGREVGSEAYKSQKGFGFGLMNCKGIIDKYKKTNSLFSVCRFNIESTIGKGSRFSFRLPKGVIKCIILLFALMPFANVSAENVTDRKLEPDTKVVKDNSHPMLSLASVYADSVYFANIEGRYEAALCFADSALMCINEHVLSVEPGCNSLLSILPANGCPDIDLWNEGIAVDYSIILDVRNELAVAALALNEWDVYSYNNKVYTRLYKLMSQDNSLTSYCEEMNASANNLQTILIVLLVVVVIGLFAFLLTYYHLHILKTFNQRQLVQLGSHLFANNTDRWIETLRYDISDIKAIDALAIGVRRGESNQLDIMKSNHWPDVPYIEDFMNKTIKDRKIMPFESGMLRLYPLSIEDGNTDTIGALALAFHGRTSLSDDEQQVLEKVAKFVATYLYYADMKVEMRQNELMMKEDEKVRTEREEADVHVQNLVLDNCLSAIKHETMYYPSRIKVLLQNDAKNVNEDDAVDDNSQHADEIGKVKKQNIQDIKELLQYYNEVYTLLCGQASSQLNKVLFKRKHVEAESLSSWAVRSMKKLNKKYCTNIPLSVGKTDGVTFVGDEDMLHYLIENLLVAILNLNADNISISFGKTDEGHPTMHLLANGVGHVDVDKLFYADNLKYDDIEDKLNGIEWMVCRQIVREHDEHTGRRGCRINAVNESENLEINIELN